MQQET
jgi:hypothetical protein